MVRLDLLLAGFRSEPGLRGLARTALLGLSQMATAAGVLWGHLPTPDASRFDPMDSEPYSEMDDALRDAGERIPPPPGRSRGRHGPW